jgi:hypothetical protein
MLGVLVDEAVLRPDIELLRGEQEDIGSGFAPARRNVAPG